MKTLFKYLFVLLPAFGSAQDSPPIFKVNYERFENGEKSDAGLSIIYHDQIVFLSETGDKIKQFVDFNNNENVSTILFEERLFKNITPFDELPKPTFEDKTEDILGYYCRYASYTYFSNSIEVWFTEETIPKGSPYSKFVE